ncbi:MAG: RloB domain-containing protein [Alphaproteobacteria bacterium]|nr:RloB domain-containing protein [Alphaproteobacteria bacterium]
MGKHSEKVKEDRARKKREAKDRKALARNEPTRNVPEYILILCEGEKTEPYYLQAFVYDHLRLPSANVEICGKCDSAPSKILECAEQRLKEDDFDRIFCVFDRDNHTTYESTLNLISSKEKIILINSVPCFEIWFLLHFDLITKPFVKSGKKSPCDNLIKDLKKIDTYFKNYEKGEKSYFDFLKSRMETAKKNACNLLDHAKAYNSPNPSTKVHELIEYLEKMKEESDK